MEFLHRDSAICVCIKPVGVLSTDEPGGVPDLVRQALGDPRAVVRTVHRLDRVVGGVMLLARSSEVASALSAQIREQQFEKAYLAVTHGIPPEPDGTLTDLLFRNRSERMTHVVTQPGKGVQEATLHYTVLATADGMALLQIRLKTGRTHQIRVQFSSRNLPLVGDKKYGIPGDACDIALWSSDLTFHHPRTGKQMHFTALPPQVEPWSRFPSLYEKK